MFSTAGMHCSGMDLIVCITNRDTKRVQRLLRRDANPNLCCPLHDDVTPLHAAVTANSVSIVQLLMRSGTVCDVRDARGLTPFHLSCKLGYLKVAREILSLTNLNVLLTTDDNGNTPLLTAAEEGHVNIVEYLLGKDVYSVNAHNIQRRTALHLAAEKGYTDIVTQLIKVRASFNRRDVDGSGHTNDTPLHLAVREGHATTTLALLEAGADQLKKNHAGDTPLTLAAAKGHIDILLTLLDRHDKLGAGTVGYTQTALLISARNNQHEVTRILLRQNLSLDLYLQAVQISISAGATETLGVLVKHMPQYFLKVKDTFWTETFYSAIKPNNERIKCLRILLELYREHINEMLSNGRYLIHIAACVDDVMGLAEMLRNGADIAVRDKDGQSIVFIAFNARSYGVIEFLLHIKKAAGDYKMQHMIPPFQPSQPTNSQSCPTPTQVHHYDNPNSDNVKNVNAVLNMQTVGSVAGKLDFSETDSEENTLLHMACALNSVPILRLLVGVGRVSPDVTNVSGMTPLIYLVFNTFLQAHTDSHHARLRALVYELGCDVDRADGHGHVALHYAVVLKKETLVWELLDAGASTTPSSPDPYVPSLHTFLQKAARRSALMVNLFVLSGADLRQFRKYVCQRLGTQPPLGRELLEDRSELDSKSDTEFSDADNQVNLKGVRPHLDYIYHPLRLFDLTRIAIRLCLRRGILNKSRRLPLPNLLQNAIGLVDLLDPGP